MSIDLLAKTVSIAAPPKKVKKITGTRFAAILGLNPWQSAFEAWCDMTGTYKIPFEGNKYTEAGNAIEPKVIAYLDKKYYFGKGMLRDPEQYFGKTKQQMSYDHFPGDSIFGGMWDARTDTAVYELKTSKRVEDWYRGGVFAPPEYYKLQAALYAHLMGLDEFRLVLTILEEKDYEQPERFRPSPSNTIVKKYSLAAEYPEFWRLLDDCLKWYQGHITAGISPEWGGGRNDKEIVKALTTAHVAVESPEDGDLIPALIAQIEPLQLSVDNVLASVEEPEKKLKELKDRLKAEMMSRMGDGDKKIDALGEAYAFEVIKAVAGGIDTDKLKAAGLYDTYKKTGFTNKFTMRRKEA